MLDVHPPHEAAHTWKDFFIHIATIVLGLLIAIGLEQTVEALHHRHEAAELRERLHTESEQILHDAQRTETAQAYEVHWLAGRIAQVQAKVWQGQPLAPPAEHKPPYFASPDIPLWRSAKASALTPLLTQDEINGFSEVEYVQIRVNEYDDACKSANSKRHQLEAQFPSQPGGEVDFTKASKEDMRAYLALLTAEAETTAVYRLWINILIGAENSILKGDLKLEHIYASERAAHQRIPDIRRDIS
jgi:hypothetical protein